MYVIRYKDLNAAIEPDRKLVKLSSHNLWREPSSEGITDWEPGHEIRSEAFAISLFTAGTNEILHYHEKTWEIYQVLEGRLKIAVKPFRLGAWEAVSLDVHDMLLLTPGTLHLVDGTSQHTTQVIQSPSSTVPDKIVIAQQDEIDAAKAVLLKSA
jgi:oxalate decarboxylase/phosphoglucose isomerase-like protein (cupin superfamily)